MNYSNDNKKNYLNQHNYVVVNYLNIRFIIFISIWICRIKDNIKYIWICEIIDKLKCEII